MTIDIAKEYTKAPGGRFQKEGAFSGEDFRIAVLKPKYLEAKKAGVNLSIVLDGGYGYAPSFLEEAFGGLARELKDPAILDITFISNEQPSLVAKIKEYIEDALHESGDKS